MFWGRHCLVLFYLFLCNFAKSASSYSQKCPFAGIQNYGIYPAVYMHPNKMMASSFAAVEEPGINIGTSVNSIGRHLYHLLNDVQKPSQLQCAIPPRNCTANTKNLYYRTYDGSCNNFQHPEYGMAKRRYKRMLLPKYGDRVSSPTASITGVPLPKARLLSLSLWGETTLPDDFRTMAFLQFGQLVAHDITNFAHAPDAGDCCTNTDNKFCLPISLLPQGPITMRTGKTCSKFQRSISDADAVCPASGFPFSEKISTASAYLDLSFVYSDSEEENRKYRTYSRGLLKTSFANNRHWLLISPDKECPEGNYQCFDVPDMRNEFIPTIAALQTILVREHNRIAIALEELNPHYSDERLFQEARKINIAQYQKITYYDWLPLLIGQSYAYDSGLLQYSLSNEYVHDYDINVDPAPYAEFAAGAFRYAHNQIPGWFSMVTPDRSYNRTMRLSNFFERSENVNFISDGDNFDSLIRGLATQLQKRPDNNIDKEVRHYFNRKSSEEFGSDLKATDIQRARDYGLASYNDLRQYCGLPRACDWSGFAKEIPADKICMMQKLYASPDDVDLNVGGSLEIHTPESILGPTFQCIVAKQMLNLRTGDRFFFERENGISGFSKDQLAEIRKSSLAALLCNNADNLQSIQPNVFIFPNTRNILEYCKNIPQIDLTKWKGETQQPRYIQ